MSTGYSKIDLLGYVGNDPEMIYTESGEKGSKFSLAVNRVWTDDSGKQQKNTDWFQVIAWGQVAENCLAYLSKGRLVFASGRPRIQQWKDKEGGKRERIQVLANQVIFLDSPEPEEDDWEE